MEVLISKIGIFFTPKEVKQFQKNILFKYGKKEKQISTASSRLYYAQGINKVDENDKLKNEVPSNVFMYKRSNGISFTISLHNKHVCDTALAYDEVKKVYFIDGEEISKQKSIVGRGVAGALLAGPVGAIIGGMSGLGEVKQKEAFMVIETNDSKIIFKCDAGTKEIFERDFKNMFGNKVITTLDLKLKQEQEKLNNL